MTTQMTTINSSLGVSRVVPSGTTTGIRAEVLRRLLTDNRAWNVSGEKPEHFGDPGYNSEDRASKAGTTLQALKNSGFAIQASLHPDVQGEFMRALTGAERQRRRESYRAQHADVLGDAKVTTTSCPSGLRPVSIPDAARAAHLTEWHQRLMMTVNSANPDELVTCPPVAVGEGALLADATANATRVTRQLQGKSTVEGYAAAMAAISNIEIGLKTLISTLQTADDPTSLGDALASVETWAAMKPELKLSPGAFDTTTVRTGVYVTIVPTAPEIGVVKALLRTAGRQGEEPTALRFKVESPIMTPDGSAVSAWKLSTEAFNKQISVRASNVKRIVAPKVIVTTAWKPLAGGLASLNGHDVIIEAVSAGGEVATVVFLDTDAAAERGDSTEAFQTPSANLTESENG